MKLQPFGNAPSLRRREGLIQRGWAMGVQIVQDYSDHRDVGICLVHQPSHPVGEVHHGAALGDGHVAPTRTGFTEQEEVASALTPVFVVPLLRLPGLCWQWFTDIGQQLSGGLVEADHRPLGVVGFGIQVQHVLQWGTRSRGSPWGCTTLSLPRLKGTFHGQVVKVPKREVREWAQGAGSSYVMATRDTCIAVWGEEGSWSWVLRRVRKGPDRTAAVPRTSVCGRGSSITTTVQGGMCGEARSAARRLAWERLARSLLSCVSSSHRSNSAGPNRSLGSNSRTTR